MSEQVLGNASNPSFENPFNKADSPSQEAPFAKEGLQEEEKVFEGATKHTMQFKGTGKEYFKIWIVNWVLSLLTLGIYSAWATVRTKKYFYGNSFLDNSSFDYHAKPLQILVGRLIAMGIFITATLMSNISPIISVVIFLVLFFLIPVIIQRSIRFNHAMTSFRNIRFGFDGTPGGAYTPYFWWPLASGLTGNILYPLLHHAANHYLANNTRFGNLKFRAQLDSGYYFTTYLKMIGLFIALVLALVFLGGGFAFAAGKLASAFAGVTEVLPEPVIAVLVTAPLVLAYMSLILFSKSFIEAIIRKHYFSKIYVAGVANLGSTMTVKSLFWLYLKNTLLIVLTLGLYYPWAKVNLSQYKIENTTVHLSDKVGEVLSEQQELSSFSDELGNAFDVDVVGGL